MRQPKSSTRRANIGDRIELFLSTGRRVDGLWIGGMEKRPVLDRVEEALCLIKRYDRIRYNRLIRDLERVWVRVLPGPMGRFKSAINACEIDQRAIIGKGASLEQIASIVVHEATHARLDRCGIGYEEEMRARVEAVCVRRQLAFAARLPNPAEVRDLSERTLADVSQIDWSNSAFSERDDKGSAEALRYLGVPNGVISFIFATRLIALGVRRIMRRFIRLFRS